MKLIFYEFRKLTGTKLIPMFTMVIFVLNILVCNLWIKTDTVKYADTEMLFALYRESPDVVTDDYLLSEELAEKESARWMEAKRFGLDADFFARKEETKKYVYGEGYGDSELYAELFGRQEYIRDFPEKIRNVLNDAEATLEKMQCEDIDSGYSYEYQQNVIEIYSKILTGEMPKFEFTRGWDVYFNYGWVNIFLFFLSALYSTVIFSCDCESGAEKIIQVSRNGRSARVVAKIITLLCCLILLTVLLHGTVLLTVWMKTGLSNPWNRLSAFRDFTYCTYSITVGRYLVLFLLIKLLFLLLFSLIITFFGGFIRKYIFGFGVSAAFFGVNLFFAKTKLLTDGSVLKYFNLVSMAEVNQFFIRYRAFDLHSHAIGGFGIALSSVVLLSAVLCIILIFRNGYEITTRRAKKSRTTTEKKEKLKLREYPMSLTMTEIYKSLVASRYIYLLILLLVMKCTLAYDNIRNYNIDEAYFGYMTALAGEVTDEKLMYVKEERQKINDIMTKKEQMKEEYLNGGMSREEYREYLKEYNHAYICNDALGRVEAHTAYALEMRDMGSDVWYVYDEGWNRLFLKKTDWLLLGFLVAAASVVYPMEYERRNSEDGFASILYICKNGKKQTHRAKMLALLGIVAGVFILFTWIDFIEISTAYALPLIDAPIRSISAFSKMPVRMTVSKYVGVYYLIKLTAVLLLSVSIAGLSAVLKHQLATAAVAVAVFIPSVAQKFGGIFLNSIDYTRFIEATPWLLS